MLCAISGEPPQVPVASRKSGKVYEKRLIEAYITEHGKEPATDEALTAEDLIELDTQPTVYPRPPQMTSIPALLSLFQNEWDSLALEVYNLKKILKTTQQELSVKMYENDAAVRVIARLVKERDEARASLAKIDVGRGAAGASTNGDAMQVDSAPLPAPILEKISSVQESLSKTRRKRPVPEDWATADAISNYTTQSTSEPLYPGGTLLAVHDSGDLALVAGNDSVAGVFSLSQNRLLRPLDGEKGSITSGLWAYDRAVIATSSGVVKVFEADREDSSSFAVHAGSVNAVTLHASGSILASVGDDKTYVLYDLESMKTLTQVETDSALKCAQFHPDGHLLAAGAENGQIKIFEVRSGTLAATFELQGPVKCVFFSENGTWLAGVTEGSSSISIWDLRKAAEIKSIDTGSPVHSISWDYTGQFLASAGAGGITVEQYSKTSKEWSEIFKSATPSTRIAWGKGAHHLFSLSQPGVITTFGEIKQE